jgi:hypothetical protein
MLRKEMGVAKDIPLWRTAWQQQLILAAGLIFERPRDAGVGSVI